MECRVLVNTKDMERTEWLINRRRGIGGSDIAALCGLSKYTSPVKIYLDKIGALPPEESQSEAAYFGTLFEDMVAKEFEKRTGKKVRRRNALLQHKDYDYMLANVDRLVVGERAGLECKTASEYVKDKWEGDTIPDAYLLQCQWYMAITGFNTWYIAAIIGGNKFVWKVVERDQELIDMIIGIAKDFWENNVLTKTPPLVDGTEASSDLLKTLYPDSTPGTEIILPEEATDLIEQRAELKRQAKELEAQISECENKLKDLLKENEVGICGDKKVTWKTYSKTSIDSKKLKADQPDIYEKYSKTSSYRKFDIK